jgi:glutamyl-tRNA synthetase
MQHIGGVRTALFNYLFSRSKEAGADGKFILRLEDTDQTRTKPEYVQNTYDTFDWLKIHWDEGPDIGGPNAPYIQSERASLYRRYAMDLLRNGWAYRCFCTAERLENVRKEREAAHSGESGYDRFCRDIHPEEAAKLAESGAKYVIRFKVPLEGKTKFHDALLGDVEWENESISPDPILLKSDGFPTYHLANIVDDHLMGITHVLRAQEWLSSTPMHVLLYKAFGWEPPVFCHLPMVMGQDGKKLSKRHGATSINEFRSGGYLPEALINYIAMLGASYEEGKDIFTLAELATDFSLDKLNKAPAVFDYQKLQWYNGQYIRMKTDEELAELSMPFAIEQNLFADPKGPSNEERALYIKAMPLVRERAVLLPELPAKLAYLFAEPAMPACEEFIPKKLDAAKTAELLAMGKAVLEDWQEKALKGVDVSEEFMEEAVKEKAAAEGVKLGDLLMPLRVAISGSRVSPPLFGSIKLLGFKACISRVEKVQF